MTFSWDRLNEAARGNSAALLGFGVALAGSAGFLILALRGNHVADEHRREEEAYR